MNEKNLKSKQSADAKSTDKSAEETEVVRKPPVLDPMTVENSDDDSRRDPTVQDRPLSEDFIKAAIAEKMVEKDQGKRKLIVPIDAQAESSD